MITIIDFWAPWCGPCHMMVPVFDKLKNEFPNIAFEKVNIDESDMATVNYNIRSIPAFIMLKDGKEVSRQVGAQPLTSMQNWIKQNLTNP